MRRTRPSAKGARFDIRRTLRRSLRTRGEPFDRAWRDRRVRGRPLVLILDVSGSMSPYARALVQFGYAAMAAGRQVEVFCFGTRLTRVTRLLRTKDPDRALHEIGRTVADWEGGTRIGESLKSLLDGWSQRAALRGAVVVLCSDGLERGDPELLRAQMARLGRLAHKVVWVNPLKGSPRYEPLARGMAAALPSRGRVPLGPQPREPLGAQSDPRRLTAILRLLSFRTLLAMAADDDLIRAYDDELGPEPRHSNRGFWVVAGTLLVGGLFLLVEIFANRPLANSIGHAQDTLRRAQAAAEIVHNRTGSFEGAGAEALGGDVPDLAFRPADEVVVRPRRRERLIVGHGVGRGGAGSAGSMLLHPARGRRGPSLRRRDRLHRPDCAPGRRSSLVAQDSPAASGVEQFDRMDHVDPTRRHRGGRRGAASCSRGCRKQPRLPPSRRPLRPSRASGDRTSPAR